MKQFENVSEIRKLKQADLVPVLQDFTQEEKRELKAYLEEKNAGDVNGGGQFLHVKNFIISRQFPSQPKTSKIKFADELAKILSEV